MNGVFVPLRIRTWSGLIATWLLAACALHAADEATLRSALDRLAGEWSGEVQVRAMDGFVLKSFSATRRAAWSQDALVVETTLKDGDLTYATVARHEIRLGRLESTVTRPAQPEDRYIGELNAGALLWTNAEGNRRDAREQLSERGGELLLETSSVEPIRALGLSGLVRLEARYRRPAPAAAVAATASPAAPGEDDAAAALRASLEEERRTSAALRDRVEQAERRGAEAGSRAQAADTAEAELARARLRIAELERESAARQQQLAEAQTQAGSAARDADAAVQARRTLEDRVATAESGLAAASTEMEQLRVRLAEAERRLAQQQSDNESLVAQTRRLEEDRAALEKKTGELQAGLAAAVAAERDRAAEQPPGPVVAVAGSPAGGVVGREQLIAEVQKMERRVLELESERNAAREQMTLAQRQLDETRRLRDDTLLRFQNVVTELNTVREEKERLARANLSLQAEVRSAQFASRSQNPADPAADASRPVVGPASPATTFDGKTADMVIAALQIIGVTRGENGEDKAILDGRVYRNGDLVEAQLGITFLRIEDNALVFQDRRGREYRRRY